MCSDTSKKLDLTALGFKDYYRGQDEMSMSASDLGIATDIGLLNDGQVWLYENGTEAEGEIGRFDRFDNGGTFYVQANYESHVGTHGTLLRGCSKSNQLIEIYFDVSIKHNNVPVFETQIPLNYDLDRGDVEEYTLPAITDRE